MAPYGLSKPHINIVNTDYLIICVFLETLEETISLFGSCDLFCRSMKRATANYPSYLTNLMAVLSEICEEKTRHSFWCSQWIKFAPSLCSVC